jgi:hypothetical protein
MESVPGVPVSIIASPLRIPWLDMLFGRSETLMSKQRSTRKIDATGDIILANYPDLRRIRKEVLLMSIPTLHNLCFVKTYLCYVIPNMAQHS